MIAQHLMRTYCRKTGQPVGSLEPACLRQSLEMQGEEITAQRLHDCPQWGVHPDWLFTDGSNLDRVQEHDARAYCAFALGIVDTFWRSTAHKSRARIEAIEHHWSLVRAYELLGALDQAALSELAHALNRFLTYAPLSYRVLDQKYLPARKTADLLAETVQSGMLTKSVNQAMVRTLVQVEGYVKAGASVKTTKFEAKAKTVAMAATGPSNIRDQNLSKEYHKFAQSPSGKQNRLMAELAKEFGHYIFGDEVQEKRPRSQASALLGRLSRSHVDGNTSNVASMDLAENDMLDELNRLMEGGTSTREYEESEDDIVEIRSIPRGAVESLSKPEARDAAHIETVAVTASAPMAKPAGLSLLERLKRNTQ